MSQIKTGIATTILAPLGEEIIEIYHNKTLFIQKLTNEDPLNPEIVQGLQTVEQVFAHFKPHCNIELDREDGSTIQENFTFTGLGDFDVKKLINQSSYLKNLSVENGAYLMIIKQLKGNKSLRNVIENTETRNAFIDCLKVLTNELED